ncbi:uncharacterized protein LOC143264229 [Megachile rotundata]|uniref:uncharacterized protein LOC143264229 n=1 Tax=Megachile rotundata TaxID=143995 RepID=UPI003FD43804
MLNVVVPGKLVLTLQSIPPFVVESILALALAVLLAVPLILHIQRSSDGSMKLHTNFSTRRNIQQKERSHPVVTHYPASEFPESASSSSINLHLDSARKTISTPILQASGDNADTRRNNKRRQIYPEDEARRNATKTKEMPLKQSSSFVATNSELPIIDISAFDYDAYRYKLVEAALRKQYDDFQPPGDVVLNSIHLNDNDSMIAVRLNDRYHHSLFDFVEEYYDATKRMSKKETEYMHPLDHFLVKGTQKPETVERETETRRVEVADAVGQDEKSPRISFYDDAVNAGSMLKRDSIMKKSLRSSNPRPSSAGADSTSSKRSTYARFSGKKSATKFSRTTSSTDSASSKRDSPSSSHKREGRREISSVDGGERESINCTTISSIDSESVRSESSKLRDDHSCHSRDSSVTSKRRHADKPEVQPWISGNARMSFNRKYGQGMKTLSRNLEASRKSSIMKRSNTSQHTVLISTDPSVARVSGKNDIRPKSNQPVKLEAIRSETEESLKVDRSPSTKIFDKAESMGRKPIDNSAASPQRFSEEPTLTKEAEKDHCSTKSLKSHSERSSKLYKQPRSRTVGLAVTKVSPRLKDQALESVPMDPNLDKMAAESGRNFKEDVRQNRRTKVDLNSRNKEEEKAVVQTPEDNSRSTAVKNLGSTTTRSHSSGKKMSAASRSSQQKTAESKENTMLNNNVNFSRSTRMRSSKSPSSDRKTLKNSRMEKSGVRLGLKEIDPDGLKLPRRDSKAGVAMQASLKKYIKKLKRVLSDRDDANIGELASLSLTDAILPELESTLSTVEVQQVQNLLNMAEKKSGLL